MTTILDQKRADLVTALRDYDAELAAERKGVRAALDALGDDHQSNIPPPPAPKPRVTAAKPARKPPKKASRKKPAPAKPARKAPRKLAAPLAAHEPAKRIGRLSSKVQVRAAEDEADRKRIVEDLVEKGFERARLGQRLAPGLYDVMRRDGGIVVTWWPEEAE